MTSLRDLCQAVEASLDGDDDYAMETALVALETALGSPAGSPVSTKAARTILAAIADAEERGRREERARVAWPTTAPRLHRVTAFSEAEALLQLGRDVAGGDPMTREEAITRLRAVVDAGWAIADDTVALLTVTESPQEWASRLKADLKIQATSSSLSSEVVRLCDEVATLCTHSQWLSLVETELGYVMALSRLEAEDRAEQRANQQENGAP